MTQMSSLTTRVHCDTVPIGGCAPSGEPSSTLHTTRWLPQRCLIDLSRSSVSFSPLLWALATGLASCALQSLLYAANVRFCDVRHQRCGDGSLPRPDWWKCAVGQWVRSWFRPCFFDPVARPNHARLWPS